MTGEVVLITGAAGGLGRALSLDLSGRGARLFLLDRDGPGLDRLSDEIVDSGLEAPALCPLDLADAGPVAFDQVASILGQEFGGLDHLIHAAVHFSALSPLDQVEPADWLRSMQVNLNAPWALTVACLPLLRRSKSATVTFLGDDERISGCAYWGAYAVAKAGLRSLAAVFSEELEHAGVRVRALDPGPMRTALRAAAYLGENPASQPDPAIAAAALIEEILGLRKL